MFRLFKTVTKMSADAMIKHYTAEDVTADLMANMIAYLEYIRQSIEPQITPKEITRDFRRLSNLGFTNSANMKAIEKVKGSIDAHNKEYDNKVGALQLMEKAWQTFGNDVMIVRYDYFFKLLKKYDLVCGSFDRYTGTIPTDKIEQIEDVTKKLNDIVRKENFTPFALPIRVAEEIFFDEPTTQKIVDVCRFPYFFFEDIELFSKAVQDEFSFKPQEVHYWGQPALMLPSGDENYYKKYAPIMFIAAPVRDMTKLTLTCYNSAMRMAIEKVKGLDKYCEFVETKDPFICSCTKYGVLIYSKWGDESQDEIIKRYEQLSDAVNKSNNK
jgi:hypothetical protein